MKIYEQTAKLESKLRGLDGRIRRQILYRGALRLGMMGIWALILFYGIDYLSRMPYLIRLAFLLGVPGYGAYWFWRSHWKNYTRKMSAQEISLMVEEKNPELQSRFISTLQFQKNQKLGPGTSESLVDGMAQQAFDMVKNIKFSKIINRDWVKRATMLLLVAFLSLGICIGISPRYFFAYIGRLVVPGVKYPTRTIIVDVRYPKRIPSGDSVNLQVLVGGQIPLVGEVSLEGESASALTLSLHPSSDPGLFICALPPLTESMEMMVYVGDAEVGPILISPEPRPRLSSVKTTISPLAYTGQKETVKQTGNLRALVGSKISFEFVASKPLQSLIISSRKKTKFPKLTPSSDGLIWTASMRLEQSASYTLHLIDKLGLESRETPSYVMTALPDHPPSIKLETDLIPGEIARKSKFPLLFQVRDDIQVSGFRVMYSVATAGQNFSDQGMAREEKSLLEKVDIGAKTYTFENGVWDNSKLGLEVGNRVTFWIEAYDNATPPHVGKSQEMQFAVISAEDYLGRLLGDFVDITGNMDETLDQLGISRKKLVEILKKKKAGEKLNK